MCVQDDETGNILLSSNTESATGASVLHQLPPLVADEDLVIQLNIEKRPAVGDSLLATTDILQVRSDISGSLESYSAKDVESSRNAAAYCSEHWPAGLQETAGGSVEEQAACEVSERNDEAPEIDLYNIDCDALLRDLDAVMIEREFQVISGGRSAENNDKLETCLLQPAPFEDAIDGPPSSSASPSTVVPDTFGYQVPRIAFSLPCAMGSYTADSVPDFPLPTAAARPVSATAVWKSHLVDNVLAATHSLVQNGNRCEVQSCSLPANMSANSGFRASIQHPASLPKHVAVTPKTVTPMSQQRYSVDAAVSAGLAVKPQSPAVTATDRAVSVSSQPHLLAVMTPYGGMSVCSPVGQITGPMNDLSIDNDRHPLLRGALTEAAQSDGRDQRKNPADQVSLMVLVLVFILFLLI